jgi:rhomboid protease GluP
MTDATPRPPDWRPLPRALTTLVLLIVGVEVLLQLADLGLVGDGTLRPRVYLVGAFWAVLFHGAEPVFSLQPVTMFVTHALLHGGLLHLAMNMAVLLGLGRLIGDRYGARAILPLFLLSAIGGGASFAALNVSDVPMVGASGAVFGFLGVWTAWDWCRHQAAGVSTRPVLMRVLALVLINVVFFLGLGGMIAWEAHLGGYLVGLAFGFWLEREVASAERRARADARRARDAGER